MESCLAREKDIEVPQGYWGPHGDIILRVSVFEVVKVVKTRMIFKYIHEDFLTEMVWIVREMTESNHAKYTAFISNSN